MGSALQGAEMQGGPRSAVVLSTTVKPQSQPVKSEDLMFRFRYQSPGSTRACEELREIAAGFP